MLRDGRSSSSALDDAVERLGAAVERAAVLPAKAREIHDRYTRGLPARPMQANVTNALDTHGKLLERLRHFQADPGPDTWPFTPISLHVDGLVLDACAHHLTLHARPDAEGDWLPVYDGAARLPALEGEFVLSFPLEAVPRQVRLQVGGFASLGIMHVRLETLAGTALPDRLVAVTGMCRDPEHLLAFDRKIAVFNEADVMKKWRSFDPPAEHGVVLEFNHAWLEPVSGSEMAGKPSEAAIKNVMFTEERFFRTQKRY
jgi:hypothetical protein